MMKLIIAAGDEYGKLTIVREVDPHISPRGTKQRKFLCDCKCGGSGEYLLSAMRCGNTSSCGCIKKEQLRVRSTTHGMSRHPLYLVWKQMRVRCYNKNDKWYECYGGRGIFVCDEWKAHFEPFRDWALSHGWKQGLQIDRVDNDGGYSPENCKISTKKQNARNKRNSRFITANGKRATLAEWAEITGMPASTIHCRITSGWSESEAVLTKKHERRA